MYQPVDQGPSSTTPPARRTGFNRAGAAVLATMVLAVGTLLLGTARAPSAAANATTTDFAPTERHAKVARLVSSMFERSHYRQAPVNDPVSSLVLDRYLESIDGNRGYFLQSDIAEFEQYRYELDDAITDRQRRTGLRDLQSLPAAQPRAHGVRLKLLDMPSRTSRSTSPSSSTASTRPGRNTTAELDDLWRKRVKNDALVADAHGQDLDRDRATSSASVTSGCQARRTGRQPTTCSRHS